MSDIDEQNESQEQPTEKSKSELFAENPDRFEDLANCVLVVKRDPETGKLMVLDQTKNIEESYIVEGYVKDGLSARRNQRRMKAAQEINKIVKPNGNAFMNGIRGLRKN